MTLLSHKRNRNDQVGFTLIELLVVIIILGILSAVVVFAVRSSSDKGKAAAVATDGRTIRTAQEAYCAKAGHYGSMPQLTGQAPANGTTETYKFLSEESEYFSVATGVDGLVGGQGKCPGEPSRYRLDCKDGSVPPNCGSVDGPPVLLGSWERTGDMVFGGRDKHTTTLLVDGRVLVAGGRLNGTPTLTSELYDPEFGTWSEAGPLEAFHFLHTATRLADGRVLVVGGNDAGGNATKIAEIYDPNVGGGTWTLTAELNVPREQHTATLLDTGQVLVAGGRGCSSGPCDGGNSYTAELFTPATPAWTMTGAMSRPTATTSAAILPGGRVIVPGGQGHRPDGADIYDVGTGTWSQAPKMSKWRMQHGVVQMPGGKVMAVSGALDGGTTTEQFDSSQPVPSWSNSADVAINRRAFFWAVLPNGEVLIAGGILTSMGTSSEIYNPARNEWRPGPRMMAAHGSSGSPGAISSEAPVLSVNCGGNCGKILLAGENSSSRMAQLYNPAGQGPAGATPPPNDAFAAAPLISNGLVTGSVTGDNINATRESGEPNHRPSPSLLPLPEAEFGTGSVWYRWIAPASGEVTIDTLGSELNTLLGVYVGPIIGTPTVANLAPVAKNDDGTGIAPRSSVTFNATVETEYWIAVDGSGPLADARGPLKMNWAMQP